jgi:peptidoglycan/LPS O-acetylase OafA/YrhL
MGNYWAFWKRGWWAWLMALCANIGFGLFIVPLAFALHDNKPAYWLSALLVWLVIGAPLWGWLFEYFAAGSQRLVSKETFDDIAA